MQVGTRPSSLRVGLLPVEAYKTSKVSCMIQTDPSANGANNSCFSHEHLRCSTFGGNVAQKLAGFYKEIRWILSITNNRSLGPIEGPPLQHSTPERSHSGSGVNNYGYDLHEVHTSEGGARVVQTHGSGHILSPTLLHESSLTAHDRSMETVIHSRSGVPTAAFHGRPNGAGFDSSARSPQADLNVSQTSERLHGILKTSDSWKRFPSPDDT